MRHCGCKERLASQPLGVFPQSSGCPAGVLQQLVVHSGFPLNHNSARVIQGCTKPHFTGPNLISSFLMFRLCLSPKTCAETPNIQLIASCIHSLRLPNKNDSHSRDMTAGHTWCHWYGRGLVSKLGNPNGRLASRFPLNQPQKGTFCLKQLGWLVFFERTNHFWVGSAFEFLIFRVKVPLWMMARCMHFGGEPLSGCLGKPKGRQPFGVRLIVLAKPHSPKSIAKTKNKNVVSQNGGPTKRLVSFWCTLKTKLQKGENPSFRIPF